ncbi:unnamed protein product, partial [Allacma fusca]
GKTRILKFTRRDYLLKR